jgi:ABC-type oligopeptide transport system ATPase subunit
MARLPRELSGGQLQRIGIARALATRPKLIVCDEPVAALDVLIRAQVINLLRDIQEELGVAYLFITHDLALLRAIADRALVMRNGGIVERARIDQLYTQPQHPYTQALLAAVPRIEPRRREPPSDDTVAS